MVKAHCQLHAAGGAQRNIIHGSCCLMESLLLLLLLLLLFQSCRYLPIGGLRDFVTESVTLAYGDDSNVVTNGQVAAVQSLSGTGSCRLFAEFQRRFMPHSTVYIPVPTWSNHHNIWRDAGVAQKAYRCAKLHKQVGLVAGRMARVV
jgi:aspartate/tyrosine/aromatic aminotransferase